MISLKGLTNSPKMHYSNVTSNWKPKGNMDIERQNCGVFTKQKIMVADDPSHFQAANERQSSLGNDFGSQLKKFATGADYLRESGVDYGSAISQLGPLGKPTQHRNSEITGGIRGAEYEPLSRLSVYNIGQEKTNLSTTFIANVNHFETHKVNDGAVRDILQVSVEPTKTYKLSTKNALHFSDSIKQHCMTNNLKELVTFDVHSGHKTKPVFDETKVVSVSFGINNDRIQVNDVNGEKNTGKTFESNSRQREGTASIKNLDTYDVTSERNTRNRFDALRTDNDRQLVNQILSYKTKIAGVSASPWTNNVQIDKVENNVVLNQQIHSKPIQYKPIINQIKKDYSIKVIDTKPSRRLSGNFKDNYVPEAYLPH